MVGVASKIIAFDYKSIKKIFETYEPYQIIGVTI